MSRVDLDKYKKDRNDIFNRIKADFSLPEGKKFLTEEERLILKEELKECDLKYEQLAVTYKAGPAWLNVDS